MSIILANLDNPTIVDHYKNSVIGLNETVATAFINQLKSEAPNHPVAQELENLYKTKYNK